MSHDPGPPTPEVQAVSDRLIQAALAYPEATLDLPWGHPALKVRGKAFVFMAAFGDGLSFSAKLPESHPAALMLPFAKPTGYGLGKSGWVSAHFAPHEPVPEDLLLAWMDESYRCIAPKKLVATLPPPE